MKKKTDAFGRIFLIVSLVFFLWPSAAFSWGAIWKAVETHQYILSGAMELAGRDPAFNQPFPTVQELRNQDCVVVTPLGKIGPGPDVDGNSPFSWHYYNPLTEKGKGEAPRQTGLFFNEMMAKRVRREDQSKEAAWSAHFLADMFVPYHVVGMPEEDAWVALMTGRPLDEREAGPSRLYSPSSPPPAGWGNKGDFSDALQLLFTEYPPGNEDGVDWFDPWYFNGYGGTSSQGIATGSHGWWEFTAWTQMSGENVRVLMGRLLREFPYDPLWKNRKSTMGSDFWKEQGLAAEAFAASSASWTRKNMEVVLQNPDLGIAHAIRAVYTLYRASMTSIRTGWRQEPRTEGYRIYAIVNNALPGESLYDVDLRLLYLEKGKWQASNIQRINTPIPSGGISESFWDVRSDGPLDCILEVSGIYLKTPDLGYVNMPFRTKGREPEGEKWTVSGSAAFSMLNYPEGKKINNVFLLFPLTGGAVSGKVNILYEPLRSGGMKPVNLLLNLTGNFDGEKLSGTYEGYHENVFWAGRSSVAGKWEGHLFGEQLKGTLLLENQGKTFSLGFICRVSKPR